MMSRKVTAFPPVLPPIRRKSRKYSAERAIWLTELFPEKFESLSLAPSKWTASDLPRENAQS